MVNKLIAFPTAILLAFSILGSGCMTSESLSAGPAPLASVSDLDPEIAKALETIERYPNTAAVYNNLAVAHIKNARKSGDFESYIKAESAVDRALELSATDLTARKLKASLALSLHRFPEGLERGKSLISEYPRDAFGFGILTDANVELGNYDEAVVAVQQMVDLRPDSNSYARVAHIRSIYGDIDGAIEMFKMAARTADPGDREAQAWSLVQLGNQYLGIGKYPAAESSIDEALSILPDYHLALTAKGRVRAAQNDLAGAIAILTKKIETLPDPQSLILLGDIHLKQGEAVSAKAFYKRAEDMDDLDPSRKAQLWADQGIRLTEALALATEEIGHEKDLYSEAVLAWCLYKNGRFADAKAEMERSMRTKKRDARMLYQLGMIESALGNNRAAVSHLNDAIKLDPAFDLIQVDIAKQKLNELGNKN